MKIQQIKIEQIKPYWRNPRNNDNAIEAVKQSIESYGFNSPLVLDKNNIIIAGHTRYKALIQLGWTEVPCVIVDIDPMKAKEYRIADNKTSELAIWDMDKLIPELRELDNENFQAFFPELDLTSLLEESSGAGVSNFADPTTEQINTLSDIIDNKFERASNDVGYIEIICPHCEELHYLNKEDIKGLPVVANDREWTFWAKSTNPMV